MEKLSREQKGAVREAVGSNGFPDYPGIVKVDSFRGVAYIRRDGELVGKIGPRGEVLEATDELSAVLDAIVAWWGE